MGRSKRRVPLVKGICLLFFLVPAGREDADGVAHGVLLCNFGRGAFGGEGGAAAYLGVDAVAVGRLLETGAWLQGVVRLRHRPLQPHVPARVAPLLLRPLLYPRTHSLQFLILF